MKTYKTRSDSMKNIKFLSSVFVILYALILSSCPGVGNLPTSTDSSKNGSNPGTLAPIEGFVAYQGVSSSVALSVIFKLYGKENAAKYMIYSSETNNVSNAKIIIDSRTNFDLSFSYPRSLYSLSGKTLYYWARYSDGENLSEFSEVQAVKF